MGKKLTQTEFVSRANAVHYGKYDYSKTKYINAITKVTIICSEHGEFQQLPFNHLSGARCPKCAKLLSSDSMRKTTSEFIEEATKIHNGKYDYSKVEYNREHENVTIICPEHGEFLQTPHNHLQGKGCPKCGLIRKGLLQRSNTQEFIEKATKIHNGKYDYSKVNYVTNRSPLIITCPTHGDFIQAPDNHLSGKGCPKCSHTQSTAELEIIDYIQQHLSEDDILTRNREILDGREIDILLPKYNIGIEYNGLYWHSDAIKPSPQYHKEKMILANNKGYRLIQIFEDEWLEHKDIVLNKIGHFIHADNKNIVIGARKTNVKEIGYDEAKEFLNQYHIQGAVPSTVYLGSFFNDELVGVMTLKEESKGMWDLTRFATKTLYRLPGVASKLFKYFLNNYEYNEIKSFLDLRWNQPLGNNTLYDKLNFVLTEIESPDYRYIVGNKRIHKFNFRKQILHKKYGFSLELTEREMAQKLGVHRIYDCGLAKYVYKHKKGID